MIRPVRVLMLATAFVLVGAIPAHASCGAAFCIVNTDWSSQGVWAEHGARFDLRYEAIDLDQPRAGSDRVAVGQVPRHHDEVETRNRNWVATADWSFAAQWAASLVVPFVEREHLHLHNHRGAQVEERWDFRKLGDVRLSAWRQVSGPEDPAAPRSAGVGIGVKLPTGQHDVANAQGVQAERTLQPGTGTTDALLGAYLNGELPAQNTSWFVRAAAMLPLASRAGFRPGPQAQLDVGARYSPMPAVGLMAQANALAKGRDKGENAEPEDSGQRGLFASLGAAWNPVRDFQVYGFVQWPLYQYVNGVQLTAARSFLAGGSWRF